MPVRSVLIVVNPAAGRGRAGILADKVEFLAREAGISIGRLTISPPAKGGSGAGAGKVPAGGGASGLMDSPPRIAIPPGADAVIAIGGDGTLNAVVNSAADPLPPILPVPAGTSNSVARELGAPADPAAVARALICGIERRVDAIEWKSGGRPAARALLCVSAGFDAAVVHAVSGARRGTASYLSYAGPILRTLAGFRFDAMEIEADGSPVVGGITTAIVCNTRRYGGPLVAAPSAVPDDGRLDLCAVRAGSRTGLVLCGLAALLSRTDKSDRIRLARGEVFRITSLPASRIPVQADGEAAGFLSGGETLEARCLRGDVRVLVPPEA
ncbi:MAG: diacylglycerol kinase family protein [Planctomycetota bacterium]|nr:diacylglycerol kinase family protein [Planctomycetota bacterium]